MTATIHPLRTTILVGLGAGLLFLPLSSLLTPLVGWPAALSIILWTAMAFYSILLARWSGRIRKIMVFPLVLLLLVLVFGRLEFPLVFGILALVTLSWIRSALCFRRPLFQALAAEILLCLAGTGALLAFFSPALPGRPFAIWILFLIQALYFVFFPVSADQQFGKPGPDAFELARRQADKILSV